MNKEGSAKQEYLEPGFLLDKYSEYQKDGTMVDRIWSAIQKSRGKSCTQIQR